MLLEMSHYKKSDQNSCKYAGTVYYDIPYLSRSSGHDKLMKLIGHCIAGSDCKRNEYIRTLLFSYVIPGKSKEWSKYCIFCKMCSLTNRKIYFFSKCLLFLICPFIKIRLNYLSYRPADHMTFWSWFFRVLSRKTKYDNHAKHR